MLGYPTMPRQLRKANMPPSGTWELVDWHRDRAAVYSKKATWWICVALVFLAVAVIARIVGMVVS